MTDVDLSKTTHGEEEAFLLFKHKFELLSPPPKIPVVSGGLGTQFWIYFIVSMAQVVLAALRTADQFYKAAFLSGNGDMFAKFEAIISLVAIEGGLVVLATLRAANKKHYSERSSVIGMVMMAAISTLAGLGQSINLVENVNPDILLYLQYVLAIVLGVGVTIIALIGGDVLGGLIVKTSERIEGAEDKYTDDLRKYNDGLLSAWNKSAERKISRGEITGASSSFSRTNERTSNLINAGQSEKKDRVLKYVDEVSAKEGRVPGPSEISREVGVAKSYAHSIISHVNNNGRNKVTVPDVRDMTHEERMDIAKLSVEETMSTFHVTQITAENWRKWLYDNGYSIKFL